MHPPKTYKLYFQQIRPVAKCDAEDGRIVGHLLMDLAVETKPKELAHAIRGFANRMAMLRECGLCHIGDMLVAMLAAGALSNSEHAPLEKTACDPASTTVAQAAAIGGMLAERARSGSVAATAVHQAVGSLAVLRTLKAQHAWFVPMLEVLLVPPEAAEFPPRRIMRRLSTMVTPLRMAHDLSTTNFDSVVRAHPATS